MLSFLPAGADENLLVGLESPDDAAVYALDEGRVLVATVDFFTPLVDDAEDFGAIAAANALSDLYAMGATPAFALSVLAVPSQVLPAETIAGILRGAADVCAEAGIVIAGGHSIDDEEPKFGLVALGFASREGLYRRSGARAGDALVLGKALGTGVISTAIKNGAAPIPAARAAVLSMRQLNRDAVGMLTGHDVHAVTDVTGFGLLGHLRELCQASGVSARVWASSPRLLPDVLELAEAGHVPDGTRRNRQSLARFVDWEPTIPDSLRTVLCDAQTSGGLLAAVAPHEAAELVAEWESAGYAAAAIGKVEDTGSALIVVEA